MNQDLIMAILRMLLSLGVVLGLAVVLIRWVLPRLTGMPTGDRVGIEILGVRPLDRQNKLAVVRAEGQRMLLAFGPSGVTRLSSRPDEEAAELTNGESVAAETSA